jgi:hypothetical protein
VEVHKLGRVPEAAGSPELVGSMVGIELAAQLGSRKYEDRTLACRVATKERQESETE